MGTFKSWIPIFVTIAGTVVGAVTPAVERYWSSHPTTTIVIAGVWAILKGLFPSPITAASQPGAIVTKDGVVTHVTAH
jgi:hypothetical protein